MPRFNDKISLMLKFKFFQLLMISCLLTGTLTACNEPENDSAGTKIPFTGVYSWSFEIPGMGEQVSVFTFYADSIRYEMTGTAYTNTYVQELVSYDAGEQRCVTVAKGGGKDGIYFVMFFKDITGSTITIYKKQCRTKEEALTMAKPEAGTKADHGWNVYRQ